jgi:hypothetical protein
MNIIKRDGFKVAMGDGKKKERANCNLDANVVQC